MILINAEQAFGTINKKYLEKWGSQDFQKFNKKLKYY